MLTDFEGFFQQFFQGMHQFWGWGWEGSVQVRWMVTKAREKNLDNINDRV